jgi:hypothetical protein
MFRSLAAVAAITLAAVLPASAATNLPPLPAHITYSTALVPAYYGSGEYAGTLNLDIGKDGALNGYYRFADSGTFQAVTGGLDGDRIWLDLGSAGLHVTGTLTDGKIVGYTNFMGHQQPYRFTATPEAPHL